MAEARQKMINKRFGGKSASTGGKGAVRRKKLGATNIPGIEEVNLFKEDGKVIHFVNPKVQASISANTYIVSEPSDTKPLQDLLPGIVSQLGMDNIQQLQQAMGGAGGMPSGMGGGMPGMGGGMPGMPGMGGMPSMGAGAADDDDDDDDVPDLVDGNFEDQAE